MRVTADLFRSRTGRSSSPHLFDGANAERSPARISGGGKKQKQNPNQSDKQLFTRFCASEQEVNLVLQTPPSSPRAAAAGWTRRLTVLPRQRPSHGMCVQRKAIRGGRRGSDGQTESWQPEHSVCISRLKAGFRFLDRGDENKTIH